jgi:hypothetical protein
MLENVYWTCGFVLACILLYRFGLPMLRRFDEENIRRIIRQQQDKSDPNAHFRHTLEIAEEQVEAVQEIKVGAITQYLFEAEIFLTREAAEEKRAERMGVLARRFYAELPTALTSRSGPRAPLSARERAARRWSRRDDGETLH